MTQPVTILRLGHRGDGVATEDGQTIFAPRTLPGEVVEGEREGNRIPKPKIVNPSSERVRPSCPHYKRCGGCALQHAAESFTSHWKEEQVRRALEANDLQATFRPILTSPPRSRRRATFALKRTKLGAIVGFRAPASHEIADIPSCELIDTDLASARPFLEQVARELGTRKGVLSATLTALDTGLDITLTGGRSLDHSELEGLAALARSFGIIRITWNGETLTQEARPRVSFSGISVAPPPGSFLQATKEGEEALRSAVLEITQGAGRVADLFAGVGTFALPLSRHAETHAVENSPEMLDALDEAWRSHGGLRRLSVEERDLHKRPLLGEELARFDGVVIDPPRAGALEQSVELARAGPERVAAVSCNPVTFARDAARLSAGGYRIEWVQVIDQFRWSTHVELVACMSRRHIPPGV